MEPYVTYHKPGETAESLQVGDIILTRGDSFYSKAILFGQVVGGAKLSEVTHAVISTGGYDTVEALSEGVIRTDLRSYKNWYYAVVHTGVHYVDIAQIEKFLDSVVFAKTAYGWFHVVSIIVTLLTKTEIFFADSETEICSGLVAAALTRAGYVWSKPPSHMMPSDLADYFSVDLPETEKA